MNESLAKVERIISSNDASSLKKSLQLDASSYFLWLYEILLIPVKEYQEDIDYSYLNKVFNYLKHIYIKRFNKEKYKDKLE